MAASLETQRKHIAERVRELRRARQWTQAELGKQLELSQSRLSEIESGSGSFTAEQLLRVLALFNVGVEEFASQRNDSELELQNALVRFGAKHLVESERVLNPRRLTELSDVVVEALLTGTPRLLTALAPVLVAHARKLPLDTIYAELENVGRGRRLAWVIANTLDAIRQLASARDGATWKAIRIRVDSPFTMFLRYVTDVEAKRPARKALEDLVDDTIRSEKTLEVVRHASSPLSRRWHVLSALQVEDFVEALRASQ